MKAPKNRKVYVIGYGAATPLGRTFDLTWERAVRGEAGFRKVTRCQVNSASDVVGEIPDWHPLELDFTDAKEVYNWNASFVILTMAVCKEALERSGIVIDNQIAPRTACLIGSALNGTDAFRIAVHDLEHRGPLRVSPYLLPNLCANVPAGKAGMLLKFTGPVFSPQGACASGNYAIGIGAKMIRDGDCDFVLAGGADAPILPELIHGFANMNATIKINARDRAYDNPSLASRPFSVDRRGLSLRRERRPSSWRPMKQLPPAGLRLKRRFWASAGIQTPFIIQVPIQRLLSAPCAKQSMTPVCSREIFNTSMLTGHPRPRVTARKCSVCGKFSGKR